MQTIVRKGSFDSAHRVMHEKFKCFNVHGHTYLYELHYGFRQMKEIGYAVDFKEIKRIACQWIDDMLDHGCILNPADEALIATCSIVESKMWLMSLNGLAYCNPTVENIAKEVFIACNWLMRDQDLSLRKVVLYETPNCYTEVTGVDIHPAETDNFFKYKLAQLEHYKATKGIVEYDMRKIELGHD